MKTKDQKPENDREGTNMGEKEAGEMLLLVVIALVIFFVLVLLTGLTVDPVSLNEFLQTPQPMPLPWHW